MQGGVATARATVGTGLDSHACASTERSWPRVAVSLDCLATVHPPVVLQTPDVIRRSSCLARGARDLSTGMKRLQHQVSSGHLDPPARATATSSSLARKPRWRATRVGSPPERTKRVARLSSRTLHWLTHRASVLPSRRSKHTGEDHAEAAGRHGGGLRRAGPSPAFRAIRSIPTGLGNAEPDRRIRP